MYGKKFKKIDYIDCKIIAFKVKKKKLSLHLAKSGSTDFEFPWFKFFSLLKGKVFRIIVMK
jgi:hypothetical protein